MVNTHEAKTHLSQLLDRASNGEEIIIARAGRPIARLVGLTPSDRERTGGAWRGLVHIRDDFDDPLPEDAGRGFRDPS